jgi:sugar lactone lactonase YvrE
VECFSTVRAGDRARALSAPAPAPCSELEPVEETMQSVRRVVGRGRRVVIFAAVLLAILGFAGCSDDGPTLPGPIPAAEKDGVLYDVAGKAGESGYLGDGGPATECLLYWPIDMTMLPTGELIVVDWNNHCLRKIATDGTIRRYIGSAHLGDDREGPMDMIDFNHCSDVKVGPDGDFYVAAFHNWAIRKVDPRTGMATTPIGTSRGFEGDGGPASVAKFDLPGSIVFDPAGNLYITDQGNMRIRRVDTQGIVTTFAGSTNGYADGVGEAAMFDFYGGTTTGTGPRSGCVEISRDGSTIYVADTGSHRIRKIDVATRMVTTIAGTGEAGYSGDGGPALAARLSEPSDVAVSAAGDIYFSDRSNYVIRRIDTSGIISTVVGIGTAGVSPNATLATSAKLNYPLGVTFDDATNTLYIADMYNHQIKRVKNPKPTPVEEEIGLLYDVAGQSDGPGRGRDEVPGVESRLYWPQDLTMDALGVLFIADWNNHVIRGVRPNGTIFHAMGSGNHGDDSNGPILAVNLNHPDGVAIGPDGNIYVCSWHNWKIKKWTVATGIVSSPVGTDNGFAGDGGPATEARISLPSSVVWDPAGNMYISDQGNQRIRWVDADGLIWTFAGGAAGYQDGIGEAAQFSFPAGTDAYPGGRIDISADGLFLYVADTRNNRIRRIEIATREVTTFGGTGEAGYAGDGGPVSQAQFNAPTDVECAENGDIYVADSNNHVVRKIAADGTVTTVAGTGVAGFSPNAMPARQAQLDLPSCVYFDERAQTLYISDTFNSQVKRVKVRASS